jgi:hypothetical protein
MYIVINKYDENNVLFSNPINNTIINDGQFIRIMYSSDNIMLNGLYFAINLQSCRREKYYNKYKYTFNVHDNADIIEYLKNVEYNILDKIDTNKYKLPQYKINELLANGNIKSLHLSNNNSFILKISGVWETQFEYGLTYKLLTINPSVV